MTEETRTKAERLVGSVIGLFDQNPEREGLRDTPRRYVKLMEEFTTPAPFNLTTFDAEGHDQMIVQSDIDFYSLCEHHMVPFFGHGTIAYIPEKRIVGLSKLSRTLDHYARRLQNQERITGQVADFLAEKLQARGVAVSLKARHLCQEMRGARKPETWTTTTALRGVFLNDPSARAEFLTHVRP